MIKENKEKQREKNGNNSTVKTEIAGTQVSQTSESGVKEESNTELNLSESDEGESSCKKNGLRVSGSTTPVGTNICTHAEHKPVIATVSVSTVPVVSNRTSTSSQGSGEMCLPDSTSEGVKTEEPSLPENPTSCSAVVKTEVNGNSNHEFPNNAGTGTTPSGESCENVLPLGIPLPTTTGPPPNGVQPLPSNVINKQPGTMEAQYMQQQSQIFVFSTNLANKSAEAVLQGQFPSIIAYHCAQPGTKKYLEKHPLKMNQFNRQNPAQWLNSLAQMKQKGGPGIMKGLPGGFQGANIVGEMGTNPGSGSGIGVWNQTNNNGSNNPTSTSTNTSSNNSNSCNNNVLSNISPATTCGNPLMQSCSSNIIQGCSASSLPGAIKTPGIDSPCLMSASPNTNSILPNLGTHSPSVPASNTPLLPGGPDMAGSPVMNHSNIAQPSLTGVKVPDENLTPQQRQHREEQLATLRKMQQMLFPEHHSPIPEGNSLPQPSEGLVMHGLGPVVNMGTGTTTTGPGNGSTSASGSVPVPGQGTGAAPVSGSGSAPGTGPGPGPVTGAGQGPVPGAGTGSGPGPGPGPGPGSGSTPAPGAGAGPSPTSAPASGTAPVPAPGSGPAPVPAAGPGPAVAPSAVAGGPNGGNGSAIIAQKNLMPGCGSNPMTPTSAAAQIEWQKLQHQFYEERKKKASSSLVGGSSGTGIGSPVGPSTPTSGGPGCTSNRVPVQSTGSQCVSGVTNTQGPRAQGPPPPYHQTARSASVPTAMSSPNPASPNNPTSNLSLPSPRAASGLNSPSDSNRSQFSIGAGNSNSATRLMGSGPSPTGVHNSSLDSPTASRPLHPSNPSTPVSTHLSPSASRKENLQNGSDFPVMTPSASSQSTSSTVPNHQPPVDGMFCRTLQSLAQQKQQQQLGNTSSKEPNLMPVPSPQQIQYLNTFEGQELTIQKQPNTSLKETGIQSPSVTPSGHEGNLPPSGSDLNSSRMSGPATPLTPSSIEFNSRCPPSNSDVNRFPIPSPHTPGSDSRSQQSQQQTPQPSQTPQSQSQQQPQTSQQSQQPLTPQQRDRFPGPSPQSQGSRTPGMESSIKTPTTEVSSRFLSSSPQMTENSTQPRFSNSSGSTTGTSPAMGNQNQNFMQQTPPSMSNMKVSSQFLDVSPSSATSAAVDVSPTSSGNFPCLRSENVPLNPNGNGGVPCSGKMPHFDPIVSMAQMSQQLTSSVANSPGSQTSTLMSSVPGGTCTSGMMPFNASGMHGLQMNDIGSCTGLPDSQTPGGLVNSLGGPGNPSSSGSFVNIPMQSVPPHSYSPNSSVANMVPCSGTVNTTSCMNQPIAHPNTSGSPKPGNMMMNMGGPARGSSPYSASPVPQRMMGRPPGPSPYNGANVQVKASAPNTIQYLPAKPQTGNSGPRGPLSLDFLQRFANPLSNLDSKVPTHNLQYFPNNGQTNPGNVAGMNVSLNRPNGLMTGMNSQIGLSGPNCGIGGHVGGPMNSLNGPIMGPNGPIVGMNLPMTGGLVMGPGGPGIGVVPLRGGIRPGGIMRMQQIGGGMFGVPTNSGQPVGGDQMFGGGPPQNMGGGPNSQVFVPGSKSSPMGLGSAPDASQPLPPSMGQSNNFKNPPFIATSDPNYAQQFHNFQQQLYATNTRSQMNNQNVGPSQSFFVPK